MVLLLQMGSFIGFGIAAVQFHLTVAWMVFVTGFQLAGVLLSLFYRRPDYRRADEKLAALASAGATSEQAEAVGVSILKPLRGIPEAGGQLRDFLSPWLPRVRNTLLRGERGRPRRGHCKEHDASVS